MDIFSHTAFRRLTLCVLKFKKKNVLNELLARMFVVYFSLDFFYPLGNSSIFKSRSFDFLMYIK